MGKRTFTMQRVLFPLGRGNLLKRPSQRLGHERQRGADRHEEDQRQKLAGSGEPWQVERLYEDAPVPVFPSAA